MQIKKKSGRGVKLTIHLYIVSRLGVVELYLHYTCFLSVVLNYAQGLL
jgi:hypothetical protein